MSDKAEFRAKRDMTGLSQWELADILKIDRENINRWEKPGRNPPREFAMEKLDEIIARQERAVDATIETILQIEDETGHLPEVVQMTYYRTQDDYDRYGRDKGPYTLANMHAILAARELMRMGCSIEWSYPFDDDNIYHNA